jgi:hypothetical protein
MVADPHGELFDLGVGLPVVVDRPAEQLVAGLRLVETHLEDVDRGPTGVRVRVVLGLPVAVGCPGGEQDRVQLVGLDGPHRHR